MPNQPLPQRKQLRLKHWDYATPWWYFVTICTQDRKCLFGDVVDGKMILNDAGKMVERVLSKLSTKFPVELDQTQIMPNHIHTIIIVTGHLVRSSHSATQNVGAGFIPARSEDEKNTTKRAATRAAPTLGNTIGSFKSLTTNEYIRGVKNDGWESFNKRIWQRNYYEHIIRNERSLDELRIYIGDNPRKWDEDRNNPKNFCQQPQGKS